MTDTAHSKHLYPRLGIHCSTAGSISSQAGSISSQTRGNWRNSARGEEKDKGTAAEGVRESEVVKRPWNSRAHRLSL
ncbi:MAG: hypothetical protein QXU98_02200 [Candidatus Parvarchaeota archaeon]